MSIRVVKKRIDGYHQILGAMKISKRDATWTAMQRIDGIPVADFQWSSCPEGVLLPKKKRGDKIRVTYTTMNFKDF